MHLFVTLKLKKHIHKLLHIPMKRILTYCILTSLIFTTCKKTNNNIVKSNTNDKKQEATPIETKKSEKKQIKIMKPKIINPSFLLGTWTENIDDNSLFTIDKKFITYTENLENPYSYKIIKDTLFIDYNSSVFKGIITNLENNLLEIYDIENDSSLNLQKVLE